MMSMWLLYHPICDDVLGVEFFELSNDTRVGRLERDFSRAHSARAKHEVVRTGECNGGAAGQR